MISRVVLRALVGLTLLAPHAPCIAQDVSTGPITLEIPEKIMAARLLSTVQAKKPKGFLKACSNALVMLKVTIDENGKVTDEAVTSGYDELKDASLVAVKQWTYKPYEQDGHGISVGTQVSLFSLGDGESFPMYSPDGKGGVKGGNMLPLPPGCGRGPIIVRSPLKPSK